MKLTHETYGDMVIHHWPSEPRQLDYEFYSIAVEEGKELKIVLNHDNANEILRK